MLDAAPDAPADAGEHGENAGEFGDFPGELEETEPSDARRHDSHFKHALAGMTAVFGGLAFHGSVLSLVHFKRSESESSAMVLQSSGNEMPVAAAALGSRLVSVMPGIVLASNTNGRF